MEWMQAVDWKVKVMLGEIRYSSVAETRSGLEIENKLPPAEHSLSVQSLSGWCLGLRWKWNGSKYGSKKMEWSEPVREFATLLLLAIENNLWYPIIFGPCKYRILLVYCVWNNMWLQKFYCLHYFLRLWRTLAFSWVSTWMKHIDILRASCIVVSCID